MRQADGAPLRDHLEALARGGDGEARYRLDNPPKLTRHVRHLWTAFAELSATRPVNGMALSPIPLSEVRIWEENEGVQLAPWERRAILRLDAEFRAANAPVDKAGGTKGGEGAVEEV